MTSVLVICGASAVGKTTAVHRLIELDPSFELVRSATSREVRADAFGGEYIYVTREEFRGLISRGEVIEYTEYSGNYYGTPRSEIERIAALGKTPVLILDLPGARSVKAAEGIASCAVYLYDDLSVMDRRLRERYLTPSPTEEGMRRYLSRRNQNVSDYVSIVDYADSFWAFLKSSGEIDSVAEAVLKIFSGFVSGCHNSPSEIRKVAEELRAMACRELAASKKRESEV